MIDDKDASPREISSASRGLMSATGQTLAAIDTALRARAQTELAERLSELEAWQAAQAWGSGPEAERRLRPRSRQTQWGGPRVKSPASRTR